MAEIAVNTDWRLCSDAHCWQVQKRNGNFPDDHPQHPGAPRWVSQSYHVDLPSAARSLVQRQVRVADVSGYEAVLERAVRAVAELEAAMRSG